jgi:hypothetical protein
MTIHVPGMEADTSIKKCGGVILVPCNQTCHKVLIWNVVDFVSVDVRIKLIICIINKYVTKESLAVMMNNSTTINYRNNYLLPQIIKIPLVM